MEDKSSKRARRTTVPLDEVAEGDLVLLTSDAWDSTLIACFDNGVAHIGIMLRFRGTLYLAQSYPTVLDSRSAVFTPDATPKPETGVHAVLLEPFMHEIAYRYAGVLRPDPPLSEAELEAIRTRFLALYGSPWERS